MDEAPGGLVAFRPNLPLSGGTGSGTVSAWPSDMFHAVLIGINAYSDEKIRDLQFARADAEALAALLNARVEGSRHVTVLLDERATKSRIARVMTDELPREVSEDDDVLIFFAGHGSPEVDVSCGDPSIHVITHDTSFTRLASTAINMVSELSAWVRRLQARQVAVVVDASFNGGAGGRTFEGPGLWSGPRTRRLDRVSLNRLAFGRQGTILTACSDKEAAHEDWAYQHGVFTYHLLDTLARAPVGPLSLAGIYENVAGAVRTATKGAQNPAIHSSRASQPLFRLVPSGPSTPSEPSSLSGPSSSVPPTLAV